MTAALLPLMFLVGIGVGALGTLIGAGGGFLVVPLLILAFGASPAMAAGTSMIMVTVNSLVGTIAYARQGKVDWRGGLFLSGVAYPGTLLGAWAGTRLGAHQFSVIFGGVLLLLAAWMIYSTLRESQTAKPLTSAAAESGDAAVPVPSDRIGEEPVSARNWRFCQRLVERFGPVHAYCFSMPLGAALGFGIGFLGAMMGIGGGPVLVPAMIYALHFPPHIATATSQFIKALTSVGAAAVYIKSGHILMGDAVALSLGTVIGAPAGAWLSRRVSGRQIVLILAAVLLFLGIRMMSAVPSVAH